MRILTERALFFCQVFLRFPVKYTPESAGVSRLTYYPTVFWWGLLVTLLHIALTSLEIYLTLLHESFPEASSIASKLTLFTLYVIIFSNMLTEIVMFTSYAMKYTKFFDISNTLEKFDHSLQLAAPEGCMTVKSAALLATLTAAPILVDVVYHYLTLPLLKDYVTMSEKTVRLVSTMSTYCGQTCMLIHFQPVTKCIAERFRYITTKITQEVINHSSMQSLRHQNPSQSHLSQSGNSSDRINSLMIAYHLLCDAVDQANAFYCDLLLISIFYMFVSVILFLYIFFMHIVMKNVFGLVTTAVWTLSMTCYLVMVVSSSSDVTEAAGETAPAISKLITNTGVDPGLRKQLESFLLQLAKKHMIFSASGFFQIDRQMLLSMAATVTTNIVILIQFQTQPNQEQD